MSDAPGFRAWALPEGVDRPDAPPALVDVGGVGVERLDTDAAWVGGLCRALVNTGASLRARPARDLLRSLGRTGRRFGDSHDAYRKEALALLPAVAGVSPQMAVAVLDGMANDWTEDRLAGLLDRDLGGPAALDDFVTAPPAGSGRLLASGPRLCVQVVSGSVPGVSATALVRSLLVKGPTLVKPGLGDVVLPVLFARALREEDPDLADAAAVVYWPGGSAALEDAALAEAEVVVAYGGDAAVADLRRRTPVTARFQAYHHRVGVGVVGREALSADGSARTAADVAEAVALFDQRGCVSPQVVWVEEGGEVPPGAFAAEVAAALQDLDGVLPGGRLDPEEASAVQQARSLAEMLASTGSATEVHHGGAAAWTVIVHADASPEPACVGRVVRIGPVADVRDVPALLAPYRSHLQTVAVAGCGGRLEDLGRRLAAAGVSRVVPFGRAPFPPAWWSHDGQGPLRCLVRWTELESGNSAG